MSAGETRTCCPICGGDRIAYWYEGGAVRSQWRDFGAWRVSRCADCGHGFTDPTPDSSLLTRCYDTGYAAYEFGHGSAEGMEAVVDRARAAGGHRGVNIRPGQKVLDVGCGGGSFLHIAREIGAEVQGVEPSANGVETCRAQGIPVHHGDLSSFVTDAPGTYDLITANHVVEHHPDPVSLLKEMKSVLAPGGVIWIAVPNAGGFFAKALKADWHSADLPVHLHHFTQSSLSRAFSEAGLGDVDVVSKTESSFAGSAALWLRLKLSIPRRFSTPLLKPLLSSSGVFGKWLDRRGDGEAIMAQLKA